MRTGAAALAFCAACALGVGCRRAPPESDGSSTTGPGGPAAGATAPTAAAPPLDHLAPGELVEGTEQAFGLALPRDVHVESSDRGDVRAVGLVTLHAFVKYLRTHVQESTVDEGDQYADLHKVKLHGKPGALYEMHLAPAGFRGTSLLVQDVTPSPMPDLPNDAERWKAAGLTPNGKVLDPTHLD
ncbi:MAG TPA: hypothetical protein VMI75_03435 [Polyangiaceae bacterium]|nr:hypothetical protein [Polyangiaceae bacterium]